jgi:hypothetical protein
VGQGFGRWGFILGNVLIAFGAPVFVTSLVATVAAGRSGPATDRADMIAMVAGAVFMIAGLVVTVVAGRHRPAPQPQPEREYPRMVLPAEPKVLGPRLLAPQPIRPIEPLPLTLNTLDDYYDRPESDPYEDTLFPPRPVPRPRNARGWVSGDRFCEPSVSTTGTRSTGSRRRPQAG